MVLLPYALNMTEKHTRPRREGFYFEPESTSTGGKYQDNRKRLSRNKDFFVETYLANTAHSEMPIHELEAIKERSGWSWDKIAIAVGLATPRYLFRHRRTGVPFRGPLAMALRYWSYIYVDEVVPFSRDATPKRLSTYHKKRKRRGASYNPDEIDRPMPVDVALHFNEPLAVNLSDMKINTNAAKHMHERDTQVELIRPLDLDE